LQNIVDRFNNNYILNFIYANMWSKQWLTMKIQDLNTSSGTIIIYIYLLRFNNTDQSLSELLVVINIQPLYL